MSLSNQKSNLLEKSRNVVVLGMFINAATILRHLSRSGYMLWGVSHFKEEGFYSRYGTKILCPDPGINFQEWVTFMKQLSCEIGDNPALIPTSDYYVLAVDKAAKQLTMHYRFHGFGNNLRSLLTSKHTQLELAEKNGFPVPKWRLVNSEKDMLNFYKKVKGQVIIKPKLSYNWRDTPQVFGSAKVFLAGSKEELCKIYDKIKKYSTELIVMEYIAGPDENLLYWCGFARQDNTIAGSFVGQKKRLNPIHFGSASYVQLIKEPKLEQLCVRFLKKICYQGLCGIEVKRSPQDNYKLIEINPRYGLWEDIGIPVDVDLIKQAVDSLYGDTIATVQPDSYNQRWIAWHRDLPMLPHYLKERYGFLNWLWSLRPPIIINDFPLSDPRYIVGILKEQFRLFLRKIKKKC